MKNLATIMDVPITWFAPLTDDNVSELSRANPAYRFERTSAGELLVSPTGAKTSIRNVRLTAQLLRWSGDRGVVCDSNAGFHLADGALLSPDAAWIAIERWKRLTPEQQEKFGPICPDMAFELRSPSDAFQTARKKCRTYMKNGARVAVLLDPYERKVEVWRTPEDSACFENPATVVCEPFDFTLDVRDVFDV